MIELLRTLQVLTVLAWGFPLVLFGKYVVRRSAGPFDTLRSAVWLASLSVICFPLRWFIFGATIIDMPTVELALWSALYVLASGAALFLTFATYEVCRGKP